MNDSDDLHNKNVNDAFTRLFSLLVKRSSVRSELNIDYEIDEVHEILLHTDNAMIGILQGLQCAGKLMACSSMADREDISNVGYFLTLLSNLVEALYALRLDCKFELTREGY